MTVSLNNHGLFQFEQSWPLLRFVWCSTFATKLLMQLKSGKVIKQNSLVFECLLFELSLWMPSLCTSSLCTSSLCTSSLCTSSLCMSSLRMSSPACLLFRNKRKFRWVKTVTNVSVEERSDYTWHQSCWGGSFWGEYYTLTGKPVIKIWIFDSSTPLFQVINFFNKPQLLIKVNIFKSNATHNSFRKCGFVDSL